MKMKAAAKTGASEKPIKHNSALRMAAALK